MSALQETNHLESQPEADIAALYTDHYLEYEYGHLSPEELCQTELDNRYKARVAQLQIAALYLITHSSEEDLTWIQCYQAVTNQESSDSTYI